MENNVSSTIREVAQFILNNVDNEKLSQYSSEKLHSLTHGEAILSNCTIITVELRKTMENGENTNASFTYYLRPISEFLDEEGNIWAKFDNSLQVNYPSYGSSTTRQIRERMQIITEVTELAESIERSFTYEIQELVMTKSQSDEMEISKKVAAIRETISKIIRSDESILKGIRVNGERVIRSANLETIPPGEYEINLSGLNSSIVKSFTVTCTGNQFATIKRTA